MALRRRTSRRAGGIGIDTWGVDFGLLDRAGLVARQPCPLSRCAPAASSISPSCAQGRTLDLTGIQFLELNTPSSCTACARWTIRNWTAPDPAAHARPLPLLAPGEQVGTPLRRRRRCCWRAIAAGRRSSTASDLPAGLLPHRPAGTVVGPLLAQVAEETASPPAHRWWRPPA